MMASINGAQSSDYYASIGEFVQGKHASSGECGLIPLLPEMAYQLANS
jgi:hypothetical protein